MRERVKTMRFPIWRPSRVFLASSQSLNQILLYSLSSSASRLKMDPDVVHDEVNKEFYINLGKGTN